MTMPDTPTQKRVYYDLLTFQWAAFLVGVGLSVACLYVGGKDVAGTVATIGAGGAFAAGMLRDWVNKH